MEEDEDEKELRESEEDEKELKLKGFEDEKDDAEERADETEVLPAELLDAPEEEDEEEGPREDELTKLREDLLEDETSRIAVELCSSTTHLQHDPWQVASPQLPTHSAKPMGQSVTPGPTVSAAHVQSEPRSTVQE